MPVAVINQTTIYYRWSGISDAPVLVLAHSLGASQAMWLRQEQALGERYRLLLYDQRGHGQSGTPHGPYSIEQFGMDLIVLLDHFNLTRVHFCGVSLGGMVGLWLAQKHPHRLSRLIVSNTAARIEDTTLLSSRMRTIEANGLNAIVNNVLERWFSPRFHLMNPDIVEAARSMLLATPVMGYIATSQAVCELDLRAGLANIQSHTLVITGQQDQATPPSWGRSIADCIPSARHVSLDAAHLANVEAADDFNREVLAFLSSADE